MEAARSGGGATAGTGGKGKAAKTLAQTFCLVTGIVLIAVGVLGFIFGSANFGAGQNIMGQEFIVFEVNGWHNIVHLATGAFLLFMAATARSAITGALVFGVLYVVVTLWGFIDGSDIATIVPINTADNILHLVLAVAALAIGLAAGGLLGADRKDRTA